MGEHCACHTGERRLLSPGCRAKASPPGRYPVAGVWGGIRHRKAHPHPESIHLVNCWPGETTKFCKKKLVKKAAEVVMACKDDDPRRYPAGEVAGPVSHTHPALVGPALGPTQRWLKCESGLPATLQEAVASGNFPCRGLYGRSQLRRQPGQRHGRGERPVF